jgi:hypothetical protein
MAQTVTVLTSFNRRKEQVNKVANLVIKKLPPLQTSQTTIGDNQIPMIFSDAAGCGPCTAEGSAQSRSLLSSDWQLPVQPALNAHKPTLLIYFFIHNYTRFWKICKFFLRSITRTQTKYAHSAYI